MKSSEMSDSLNKPFNSFRSFEKQTIILRKSKSIDLKIKLHRCNDVMSENGTELNDLDSEEKVAWFANSNVLKEKTNIFNVKTKLSCQKCKSGMKKQKTYKENDKENFL